MFGPVNLAIRWLFSLFLVFGTYNPSGLSYYHWIKSGDAAFTTAAVAGTAMFGAYLFLVRSTWRSIKPIGVLIGATFFALFNLMLIDVGLVTVGSSGVVSVMVLASVASILAIGLSFSAIRARLAGQIDSDDVGRR